MSNSGKSKDEAEKLFEENLGLPYFVLLRYFPKYRDDEDMLQVALIAAWEAIRDYDKERASVSSLIVVAVRNALLTEIRSRKRQKRSKDNEISMEDTLPNTNIRGDKELKVCDKLAADLYEDEIEEKIDTNDLISTVFRDLTQRNRQIFQMFLSGFSLKEIGDQYGITRQRVNQVIKTIRSKFEEEKRKRR